MHRPQLSTLLLPLLAAPLPGLATFTCENIKADGHSFDLSKLRGPHSVVTTKYEPSTSGHVNTTYTLDVCDQLKKSGKSENRKSCPNGARVCAISHTLDGKNDAIGHIIAIAGDLEKAGGSQFDYTATRLKTSDSTSDAQKEGLRLVLKGGRYPLGQAGREQRAVIEFICDHNKTGTEGEWESEDKYEKSTKLRLRDENSDDGKEDDGKEDNEDGDDDGEPTEDHQLKNEGAALIWDSYGLEKDVEVLRMTWYTKYACEKRDDSDKGGDKGSDGDAGGSHWGFFTWFIIIAFLGIAAYLVFSSWLNYNRYGARGWDLLPHSDTLRDVPYLMKDWIRRVLNTVQGTGSRGGYSAV